MRDHVMFAARDFAARIRLVWLTFGVELDGCGHSDNLSKITACRDESHLHFNVSAMSGGVIACDIHVSIGVRPKNVRVRSDYSDVQLIRIILEFINGVYMSHSIPFDLETLLTMFELTKLGGLP